MFLISFITLGVFLLENDFEYFLNAFFQNTLISLVFGIVFSYVIVFTMYKKYFQKFLINDYIYTFSKYIITISFLISFMFFIMFLYNYMLYFNTLNTYTILYGYQIIPKINTNFLYIFNFEFSFDFFGLVLLFLAYFVGILSLLVLDTRFLYRNVKYLVYINFFTILVFMFVFTNNLLLLFLFYEFLLLPSVIIVYFISPSRRAIQATLYFII